MGVGLPGYLEGVGFVKDFLVAVSRNEPYGNLVPFFNLAATFLYIPGCCSPHVQSSRCPANDFIGGGCSMRVDIRQPKILLFGEHGESIEPIGQRRSRGIGAGGSQQAEKRAKFVDGQEFIIHL